MQNILAVFPVARLDHPVSRAHFESFTLVPVVQHLKVEAAKGTPYSKLIFFPFGEECKQEVRSDGPTPHETSVTERYMRKWLLYLPTHVEVANNLMWGLKRQTRPTLEECLEVAMKHVAGQGDVTITPWYQTLANFGWPQVKMRQVMARTLTAA